MSRWFEADKVGLRQIAERLVERSIDTVVADEHIGLGATRDDHAAVVERERCGE